jgi:hypothetical protein
MYEEWKRPNGQLMMREYQMVLDDKIFVLRRENGEVGAAATREKTAAEAGWRKKC